MSYLVEVIKKQTDGSVESIVKFLMKQGMMSHTSITHAEIYRTYNTYLVTYTEKKEKKAKMKAAYDTAYEYDIDYRTVYKIRSEFKDLI